MPQVNPLCISGVMPGLCIKAELGPPRTECGIGALMPWADRLWAVSYVSHKRGTGVGTGLYEIDDDFVLTKRPESCVGTYTNRLVHYPSNQLIIGPHVIDAERNIRTVDALADIRLCSTMTHLDDPDHKVYMFGMEGELFEMDVRSLEVRQLFDLVKVMKVSRPRYIHFKAAHSAFGKVVVAGNCYDEADFLGQADDGRLAEWDGQRWTILDRRPYVEVTGRGEFAARTMFAMGWDRASAILNVYTDANQRWTTYRLPKASPNYDHFWQNEWPRIRETEHERLLMDCHGMFYELSPWAYGGRVWGVRPISTHLWVLGDFCSGRGLLVMGADNASPAGDHNRLCGEPQSGLWFGKTDDLWSFGKPVGWGGPWWTQPVKGNEPSDPYLMTGFDNKCLHLSHDAAEPVEFGVEVDFLGDGSWQTYEALRVPARGYRHHEFPVGFSAHWVRIVASRDCTASAYFHYT